MPSFSFTVTQLGKDNLVFSTGELAKQAHGSMVVSLGETVVLATTCMSKEPKDTAGFLPLTVEYKEKTYAIGKIPGGYIKKEGRPKDAEILTARLIDRSLRPLFPKGLSHEIQIVVMVLSSDSKNDPDILAINGSSCALLISEIPFFSPVGAVRVIFKDNAFMLNPTYKEREGAELDIVLVGNVDKIVMIEAQASEVSRETIEGAVKFAQPAINKIIEAQKKIQAEIGKKKRQVEPFSIDNELLSRVKDLVSGDLEKVYGLVKKEEREDALADILNKLQETLKSDNEELEESIIKEAFFSVEKDFVRKKIIEENRRPDNRKLTQIRDINCAVGVLPRTHGSAVFTRGQTQALAITTLGSTADEQIIEALEGEKSKHFMLHYSFPPFSVGEVKPMRGPSRREIGHGALAEKAILSVMPTREEFPYTVRVVSEILESNGSSSMATVCASSLSLMDAGVSIKKAIAGIALGLVEEAGNYRILTDIAGVEDHYGDMDFKVAGTKEGICAIQLDVKNEGLTLKIISEALKQAQQAYFFILEKMDNVLANSREHISRHAPKIKSFPIDVDKIGSVIGPGGKTIRKIMHDNNVEIDISDEEGIVSVVAETEEDLNNAVKQIHQLVEPVEVGKIYEAKVVKITNFGAFCEIAPGKKGLLRISEIANTFVKSVEDYLREGDIVTVKVISIDDQGRINLSKKQVE